MDKDVLVYVDLEETPHLVGRPWVRQRSNKESASFEYNREWLAHRWGRVLMRRAERQRAEQEGRTLRALNEIDYLLMVDDEARQGALRFAEREGAPFLAEKGADRIPPLVELRVF